MRPSERKLHRQLESLEEERSGPSDTDDDTPLSVAIGDDPMSDWPDQPHGSGIKTFPTAEAAEAELGEEFWSDPSIKIWDHRGQSDTSPDNGK